MKKKTKNNPIKTLWSIFGNIGGILALSNMASTWKNNIIAWGGFLKSIFDTYRSVVEPISKFLFGWMPFNMCIWFGDYCVFGVIMIASMFQSNQIESTETFEARDDDEIVHCVGKGKIIELMLVIIIFLFMVIFWPFIVFSNFLAVIRISRVPEENRTAHMRIDRNEYLRTIQWMCSIIIGCVLLISLNEVF